MLCPKALDGGMEDVRVLPPRAFLKVRDGAMLTLPCCGTGDAAVHVCGPEVCAVVVALNKPSP